MDFSSFPGVGAGVGHTVGAVPMIPKLSRGIMRRNVDYTSCVITYLEMVAPVGSVEDPVTAITTKFVKTVYNKQRCPIFCTTWAPDGRRLIAGAASGEFSLWNGVNLNFEALMKSHEASVRSMEWSHNGMWMATTDDRGTVKYWQSNMNNVHSFQAHNETIRGCSFSPTDAKLATCSDDGTVRVFDFLRSSEEFILRGHGADVKCVDWHPRKNLLVSGSKDNQQPVKLWDPKSGQSVSTIHAHKAAVTSVRWNQNGNWLLTASRDHLIKLYDIRTMKEIEVLKGHKLDVNTVSWHPIHEKLFASGGSDGAILFWLVGNKRDIGGMESPHDSFVWSLAWHPLGHMLCSGSNDHTCKFWCRNRPGDEMKDRHSSGGLPVEEMADTDVFESVNLPQSGNISLPPPAKNLVGSVGLPGKTTWTSGQGPSSSVADKPAGNFPLQVLGADIIKEQFGEPGVPPPGDQNENPEPSKSGLFMHLQGGEGKEGRPPPPGEFGSPFQLSPGFPPHQNPSPGGGGLGSPDVRGPPLGSQNFHGPRGPPPPMQQQQMHGGGRRDWGEGGPDFRPQFPPRDFSSPHRHFRPNSQLASNPFSWQRQDPNRDRAAFEEEAGVGVGVGGMHRFNEGHNPYVYRREEGRLRDPREQRAPLPPGRGGGDTEEVRRQSQDEEGPEWHNRGPPPSHGWQRRQEDVRGGEGPPPRGPEFHNRETKPPTQEHFDQHRGPDFGPPQRDRNAEEFPPMTHHRMQERQGMGTQNQLPFREGENWRPPFRPERPLHEGPQHNIQGRPPPHQGSRFPHEEPRLPPRSEPHVPHPEHEKGGPITPTGVVPPQGGMGGEEREGHVHDPRSQRPPASQPLPFPPSDCQQRLPEVPQNQVPQNHAPLNQRPPPSQQPLFPPNDRQQRLPEVPLNQVPSNRVQPNQVPPNKAPPNQRPPTTQQPLFPPNDRQPRFPEVPPNQVPIPPNRQGSASLREGGPVRPIHPQAVHEPPQHQQSVRDAPMKPPEAHHGPPNGPLPHIQQGPPPPSQFRDGPPHQIPPRESPAHHPPHMNEGPPKMLLMNREGPPEAPPHHILRNMPDGPPQHVCEDRSQHNMIRDGPPQQVSHTGPHEGPPQHNIHEGPPHNPQQIRDGPPQQRHDGPPPNIHDRPPMNSPQHPNAPPHQRFDEFHGPPRGDRFFPNQPGGPNSPRPGEPPFLPPHSRPGPPIHNVNQGPPDGGPRFIGPPLMGQNQEHYHSPQHFPEPQGPPNVQRPPPQHFSGPPHLDQMSREPPHNYNQFPPDQQRLPHHPGPSDPRRPPPNFQPPDRVLPSDRGFPPPHRGLPPHRQDGGPPLHRQDGGPPPRRQEGGPPLHRQDTGPLPHRQDGGPPQSGEPPNWNQRQQFPRDSGGRFEGNRDPPPPPPPPRGGERRSSGGGGSSRGEGRGDKREREREREREGRGSRGPRDRSPKQHSSGSSSRDGQPAAKRSRSDRDSSKHSSNRSREKSSRK